MMAPLCSYRERFTPLRTEIIDALTVLLRHNISIGIASGRGKSVRRQMQDSIAHSLWQKIWVGYYNGAQVSLLSDDTTPDISCAAESSIDLLDKELRADSLIPEIAQMTTRPSQITLEPRDATLSTAELWSLVSRAVERHASLRVVFSTHSVDIIPADVSKLAVLRKLKEQLSDKQEILCVGDLGQYPGNDFELLRSRYSLSCDQASADPQSCWNLAPPAVYGPQATLYYIQRMKITGSTFKLILPKPGPPQ
jgi:hydroxymethylpyrimidine pyrophosphatase-like HAD family hydrolase